MEFRDAVKHLRTELSLTQMELANALHINFATIGRWENGKNLPNRSLATALLEFARSREVSAQCMENLTLAVANTAKERLNQLSDSLYPVEHASLSQLIDDAPFPIYVCDMETDYVLYINKKAASMIGMELDQLKDKRCYACLMHRDSPCTFCHKAELVEERFLSYDTIRDFDATIFRVRGKLIRWNGCNAQVRYVTEMGNALSIATLADVSGRLLSVDYEAVVAIDAETGKVRPYTGSYTDAESIIEQTSLPYIKLHLEKQPSFSITCSLEQGGKTIQKRVVYTYLDKMQTTIICAMRNMSECINSPEHRQINDTNRQ